jgi:hypothetical protein
MNNASEYVAYYLERLRQGQTEDAFFGLIENDPALLRALMEAFSQEENRGVRTQIVRCLWQHRRPETICFLAKLLDDPDESVWQEALDGLVAIGGSEVIRVLQEVRPKLPADRAGRAITVGWVGEALEQFQEREA